MDDRHRDGLIITGIGLFGTVGYYLAGIGLPLTGATVGVRDAPTIFPYGLGALCLLFGVCILLNIYPGWGFKWGDTLGKT